LRYRLSGEAYEYVRMLYHLHCDNSRYRYYAKYPNNDTEVSMMPLTPFVFEFFIFNSIYQVNWEKTLDNKRLIYHNDHDYVEKKESTTINNSPNKSIGERKQQNYLLDCLIKHSGKNPNILSQAFRKLRSVKEVSGDWTKTSQGQRINHEEGKKFFSIIRNLHRILTKETSKIEDKDIDLIFKQLIECVSFVYKVRCNIFHGSKSLAEINQYNQKKRINIYYVLIHGVNELFFLTISENTTKQYDTTFEWLK